MFCFDSEIVALKIEKGAKLRGIMVWTIEETISYSVIMEKIFVVIIQTEWSIFGPNEVYLG